MSVSDFLALLRARIGIVLASGVLVALLSLGAALFTEKRYEARMDFLIVQTNTDGKDYYTVFKSSEYLGKVFSEALYSERFIDAVLESGKAGDRFLPTDKQDRLEAWQDLVSTDRNLELGILSVSVQTDRDRDAIRILEAIQDVLTTKNQLFRSGDDKSVEMRVLTGPLLERNPSKRELAAVVTAGFLAGCFAALLIAGNKAGRKRETHDENPTDAITLHPALRVR